MSHASLIGPFIVASVALLALHIAIQAISVTLEFGSRWNAGPRDEGLRPKGKFAGRAERALRNYLETFPAFGTLALTLAATERFDSWGLLGGTVWLACRLLYIPLYLAGVPYVRSLVWIAAALGLTAMAWRILV